MYDKEIKLCNGLMCGYLYFYDPEHPLKVGEGSVYLHRHLASIYLGRWLLRSEFIHHKNEDKLDNSKENLEIMTSSEHIKHHNDKLYGPKILNPCLVCGKETYNKKYCSIVCARFNQRRVKERPSKEQILKELETSNFLRLGKKYGVSDNAIRKWLK